MAIFDAFTVVCDDMLCLGASRISSVEPQARVWSPPQVLTTGFWPTYKSIELALPREMVEGVELFKEFYEAENKHR
jgi:hypothetical protein